MRAAVGIFIHGVTPGGQGYSPQLIIPAMKGTRKWILDSGARGEIAGNYAGTPGK
jgi:hypothetical protein